MGTKNELRAASEERPPTYKATHPVDTNTKFCGVNIKKMSSNYDNVYQNSNPNSPLLLRKNAQQKQLWNKSQSPPPTSPAAQKQLNKQFATMTANKREKSSFLYDRRLNKSFETANGLINENTKCINEQTAKHSFFRRSSTPQLHNINDGNSRDSVTSSWCCGNFVMKQWKKINPQY